MERLANYVVHIFQVFDHKGLVFIYSLSFCKDFLLRAIFHDLSKVYPDELKGFSVTSRIFRKIPYGGSLYAEYRQKTSEVLKLHYQRSKHHPEHYEKGVQGMSLLDIVEMFVDWTAASRRQSKGSLRSSIRQNKDRFGLGEVLTDIFINERNRIRAKNSGWQ